MSGRLDVSFVAPGVCQLTVENPPRRNALDAALLDALDRALSTTPGVRAWLVRGAGGTFSAGSDLTELAAWTPGSGPFPDERLSAVLDRLAGHPAPSVALVQGPAMGAGCELMVACDLRVADATAVIAVPAARLGVVYGLPGLERYVERLGPATTRYLFLSGRRLDAAEALRRGVVDVLAEDAPAAALALCTELAQAAPRAVEGIKLGLRAVHGDLRAREAHRAVRAASLSGPDVREGIAAALERRPPRFVGD